MIGFFICFIILAILFAPLAYVWGRFLNDQISTEAALNETIKRSQEAQKRLQYLAEEELNAIREQKQRGVWKEE